MPMGVSSLLFAPSLSSSIRPNIPALHVEPALGRVVDELEFAAVEGRKPIVPVEQFDIFGLGEGRAADADAVGLAGQAGGPQLVGLAPRTDLGVTGGFVDG